MELAEYAVANEIDDEPAFKWWVKETLKRQDQIIGKVQSKYWRTSHKFGIELPKTVKDAYRIDRETGTDFLNLLVLGYYPHLQMRRSSPCPYRTRLLQYSFQDSYGSL